MTIRRSGRTGRKVADRSGAGRAAAVQPVRVPLTDIGLAEEPGRVDVADGNGVAFESRFVFGRWGFGGRAGLFVLGSAGPPPGWVTDVCRSGPGVC